MASYSVIDFSTIYSEVVSMLNLDANGAYGVINSTSTKYWDSLIRDVIRDKDFLIVQTICKTTGHSQRPAYITTLPGLLDKADLAESVGEIEPPLLETKTNNFVQGIKATAAWIDIILDDIQSGTLLLGTEEQNRKYFDVVGSTLRHSGLSAKVKVCRPLRKTDSTCASPANCHDCLKKLVLGELYGKQGDYQQSAQYYLAQGMADLGGIEAGKVLVPSFIQYISGE